jgi:hypothetical protein
MRRPRLRSISDSNLYASNSEGGGPTGHGSVTAYASGSSGDVAPVKIITSNFTGINSSSGIAVDAKGKIYLTNDSAVSDVSDPPGGSLEIFPPGSYATTAPVTVIAGDNTGLNSPQKVALDARGNISVLNANEVITVYPAGSAGNATPSATINLGGGNLGAADIARGIDGALYVANQGTFTCDGYECRQTGPGAIDIYSARANGNAKPSAVLSGYATGLASPSAIAVSRRGNIFVANQGPMACSCVCVPTGAGTVTVYAPGSTANAKPIATIAGPRTRLAMPEAIAVDASENIYVLDAAGADGFICADAQAASRPANVPSLTQLTRSIRTNGDTSIFGFFEFGEFGAQSSILVFQAGSNGDTPPIARVRGPFTALDGSAIAVGPSGP